MMNLNGLNPKRIRLPHSMIMKQKLLFKKNQALFVITTTKLTQKETQSTSKMSLQTQMTMCSLLLNLNQSLKACQSKTTSLLLNQKYQFIVKFLIAIQILNNINVMMISQSKHANNAVVMLLIALVCSISLIILQQRAQTMND